jgi:hypothetical protein
MWQYRPDAHQVSRSFEQFEIASVRKSRQSVKALQSSGRIQRSSALVNPSGRHGYFFLTVSVRQVKGFPSQTQIWEDSYNHPDGVVFCLDNILDKASSAEEV